MRRLRPTRRLLLRTLAAIVTLVVITIAATRTGRYLVRAAWEEGRLLARRRPIREMLADDAVPEATRAKLRVVLDARRFALDSLGLRAGGEFTTFSRLDRDTLVLVLSAAYRDSLAFRTWWFPVVGAVPYKGYFDFAEARRDSLRTDADGYDAVLRPASAFSTLGWFDDPLVPTTLALDSLALAETVIHELVHTTYYAPGEAVFNESLANFAGTRGAERFFRARGQQRAADEVARRWRTELVLGAFWEGLHASLDSAFRAHPGDRAARLAARRVLLDSALVRLRGPVAQVADLDPARLARIRLNTASVLSGRL
ncbi:MAG: aminopeptidase, partial [Gemmatimonadaceae bacterium]|nr:aminopeptidase [Gemmatimonadaceae bacterium]